MARLYVFLLLSLFLAPKVAIACSQLRHRYYSKTCPKAESIVRSVIRRAIIREPRNAASILRLQFHDCFVNGCDGSVLLDDTPTMLGEKQGSPNINSLRGFEVIDEVKEALERRCPGVVSCADVVIMAARDAVALSGGPSWKVKLGREDSLTASQEDCNKSLPSFQANATSLINVFRQFNLGITDLVALSGSHTIGKAHCFTIAYRLYNQSGTGRPAPDMNPEYRRKLDELCPKGGDGNVTGGLDATPVVFDNQYFKDLIQKKGLLNSDQTLYSGDARTRKLVRKFSRHQAAFFSAFVKGMIRMANLQSGKRGEIRRNCRVVNHKTS